MEVFICIVSVLAVATTIALLVSFQRAHRKAKRELEEWYAAEQAKLDAWVTAERAKNDRLSKSLSDWNPFR